MIHILNSYEFDSMNENISNNNYILCVKIPLKGFRYKFTKGKKYKMTYSEKYGYRLKDDEGNFMQLSGRLFNEIKFLAYKKTGEIFVWEYASGIFTTDASIEDYEMREDTKKYNI